MIAVLAAAAVFVLAVAAIEQLTRCNSRRRAQADRTQREA